MLWTQPRRGRSSLHHPNGIRQNRHWLDNGWVDESDWPVAATARPPWPAATVPVLSLFATAIAHVHSRPSRSSRSRIATLSNQPNGFRQACRKDTLGDGGAWIWTLHRTYFPTFEPIVDFVHALTHVYLAAKAVGGSAAAVWIRYLNWATECWQGRAATVLKELRAIHEAMPPPENREDLKPTDPYEVIRLTIGYLTNNESRMDYPRYRRAGLPTCSGLVESLVKQFNRRVKGTEKFWNPSQAETILQLRAAFLCEDETLNKHLKYRPVSAYRNYQTTRTRKVG